MVEISIRIDKVRDYDPNTYSQLYAQSQPCAQSPPSVQEEMEISSTPNPVGSGARALGMGGAFISVADEATAASWNPAGLIILKRPEISTVVSVFSGRKGYDTSRVSGEIDDLSDEQPRLNYLSVAYPFDLFSMNMVFSLNYQHLYEFSMENTQRRSYYIEVRDRIPIFLPFLLYCHVLVFCFF